MIIRNLNMLDISRKVLSSIFKKIFVFTIEKVDAKKHSYQSKIEYLLFQAVFFCTLRFDLYYDIKFISVIAMAKFYH